MTLQFLGTGTSQGIPVIGCSCPVCFSEDTRDRRLRCSVLFREGGRNLLIDTSPDFRTQALRMRLSSLDGVLYTHSHADHLHGIDDLRPLSSHTPIPVYGDWQTLTDIKSRFSYIFDPASSTPCGRLALEFANRPRLTLFEVKCRTFQIGPFSVTPIPLWHGRQQILGYRVGVVAYLTDCSRIPETSLGLLEKVEILVLGALRILPHATHMNVEEALQVHRRINPKKTYLTHLCHEVRHSELEDWLPPSVTPAHDGLVVNI